MAMEMQPSLKDIKYIEQIEKDIVHGFIKQNQALLPSNDTYYIIPTLIIHWILLYFHEREHFDPNNCSQRFKLSDNNTVATQTKRAQGKQCSVLLTKIAKSGIHKWTFVLLEKNGCTKSIGIFKCNLYKHDPDLNVNDHYYRDKSYNLNLGTGKLVKYVDDDGVSQKYASYSESCGKRAIIEMTLDLNKLGLSYCINGHDYGVAFKNITNTEYKAFVSGWGFGSAYKLLSYKQLS